MPNGTVKFFNAAKGFGFITPDDGSKDVFVPAASVSSSGIDLLKPGQRVSFEVAPDARGPMAVRLVRLAEAPRPQPANDRPTQNRKMEERHNLTFYFDSSDDKARSALEDLRAAGHNPKVIDYVVTPPKRDELKALSALLSNKNQALVKKYAPLFYDLRLNDRFLSQNEFWDAIVEHPSLINGPIVSTALDANLYNAKSGVEAFLAAHFPNTVAVEVRRPETVELPEEEPGSTEEGLDDVEPESSGETLKPRKERSSRIAKVPPNLKTKANGTAKANTAVKKAVTKSAKKPGPKTPSRRSKT